MSKNTSGAFSWDLTENHLFEVKQEDGEWVSSGTIARFHGDAASLLLRRCIDSLKREGWSYVDPEFDS